jgi:hypothetical protein
MIYGFDFFKDIFVPGLVGKYKMDMLERICPDWARKSL